MNFKSTPSHASKNHLEVNNSDEENSDNEAFNSFLLTFSKRFKGRTFLMIEMSKIFLQQAPGIKKILEESQVKQDYEAIRFEAHKFKSTVNIMGLDDLKALATETEELYYQGEPLVDTKELLINFVNQINLDVEKIEKLILAIEKAN